MKNTTPKRLQLVAAGKGRQPYQFAFSKKNSIIKNIEIIVACIIAFMAGTGLYEILK